MFLFPWSPEATCASAWKGAPCATERAATNRPGSQLTRGARSPRAEPPAQFHSARLPLEGQAAGHNGGQDLGRSRGCGLGANVAQRPFSHSPRVKRVFFKKISL